MTREDKQLLLADLCARVPYHPKGHVANACKGTECDEWLTCATFPMFVNITNNCRLYLRPMSSMTEEEKEKYCSLQDIFLCSNQYPVTNAYELFDWLDAHHFDYRGLIGKGLALEAHAGMYGKEEQQ